MKSTLTSDPGNTTKSSQTDPIVSLLAAGGITAEVVWEGTDSDCPWPLHDEGIPSAA